MDEFSHLAELPEVEIFAHLSYYRVSKNLSFTNMSICRFATNIISISSQLAAGSPNAQFGKTQFSF